jgi:spore coat protein U-like protein
MNTKHLSTSGSRLTRAAVATVIAFAIGMSAQANAAQSTGTFGVTATVAASCVVSGTSVAFGSFNVLSGSNVDATGTVTATCTNGSAYTVGLNAGLGASATVSTRKMTHTVDNTKTLNYSLSTVSSGGVNWDDIGGTTVASGTGNGTGQAITVYGRVPTGQTTPIVGAYGDTITATIDF